MLLSERDQGRDTRIEQVLYITFLRSGWFIPEMSVSDWLLQQETATTSILS